MSNFITLPHNQLIGIPESVAVCPYCGGHLYVKLESWTQEEDGTWTADEDCTHAECDTEPEEHTEEWRAWVERHSKMPYVYQLPVDVKVLKWINEHYRFDMNT